MEATAVKILTKGGEFIIKESDPQSIFIPEDWTEEQKQIASMVSDFLEVNVIPKLEKIDKMDPPNIIEELLTKAGESGILGLSVPEEFGGYGLDLNTTMLATEELGKGHSFSVAISAHTGIGTLPILYFGTEAQKQKYLPKLASGEWKACYCLTEPGSGSDALGAKTKAVLSADGKYYVLNGQKMWITNAGFAEVFTVFAKIDGTQFTGFIIEKGTEGLTLGEEEHKMGIKGSSTRQVFLTDVKVPVENVLGEIGKGHLIAFNILNIGRAKLAAAVLGGAKVTAEQSIKYANERHQFNQPISNFGAIKYKLAEQAIRIYAAESAVYRTSNYIEDYEKRLVSEGKSFKDAQLGAAQEFAAECAILKVAASEMLDYVVDEGVQIFGGYGFSADFPMDRSYRDSRINRIFEGTNEINRMLTVDYILKKALKGELNILGPAKAVQAELMSIPEFGDDNTGNPFASDQKLVANLKKALLLTAGYAAQKFMQKLGEEQEILMSIADMMINIYVGESVLLRVQKLAGIKGLPAVDIQIQILRTFLSDAADRVAFSGKTAINAMATGDELRLILIGLKRYTKTDSFNTVASRRAIADHLIEANLYNL